LVSSETYYSKTYKEGGRKKMPYTFRRNNIVVVRASRYTHAKEGYLVFWGKEPTYFRNKQSAIIFAKRKILEQKKLRETLRRRRR
jgi:hypothetical protein